MRGIVTGIAMTVWLAGSVWAQSTAEAVRDVIGAQIRAFQADDFVQAFGYASPGLRQHFGTPQAFGAMVMGGYPMVWRPGSVAFLALLGEGGERRQIVEITDGAGQRFRLEYTLIDTSEGWRIDAVRFLPVPVPLS